MALMANLTRLLGATEHQDLDDIVQELKDILLLEVELVKVNNIISNYIIVIFRSFFFFFYGEHEYQILQFVFFFTLQEGNIGIS